MSAKPTGTIFWLAGAAFNPGEDATASGGTQGCCVYPGGGHRNVHSGAEGSDGVPQFFGRNETGDVNDERFQYSTIYVSCTCTGGGAARGTSEGRGFGDGPRRRAWE